MFHFCVVAAEFRSFVRAPWSVLQPCCWPFYCDVIDDVIIIKIHFFGIIWEDLFISELKLKLCLIFQNFQNGRIFELVTNFFTWTYTGSWIDQKDSHEHFRHFELLIDALAQILTVIYHFQNLTYFVTWWRHRWCYECVKHILHN